MNRFAPVVIAALVGCQSKPETNQPAPPDEVAVVPVDAAPPITPDAAPPPLACADRKPYADACRGDDDRCVLDKTTCREPVNACERVKPATATYHHEGGARPTFRNGDPCAVVDASCGFDYARGLCQPFTALTACPSSEAEAASAAVFCMHPRQGTLVCPYTNEKKTYTCYPPELPLTGIEPPPGSRDKPILWFGKDDYFANGCPNSPTGYAARCKAKKKLKCYRGLQIIQCVRRKWRVTGEHPPPP